MNGVIRNLRRWLALSAVVLAPAALVHANGDAEPPPDSTGTGWCWRSFPRRTPRSCSATST